MALGCDGAQLGDPDGGGGSGGSVPTGMGGGGGIGGSAAGTSGGAGANWCAPGNARAVVACGLYGAPSLGLAPGGGAFVSFIDDTGFSGFRTWDSGAGAWTLLAGGGGRSTVAVPLRVDLQGRPIITQVTQDDIGVVTIVVARWDGSGWTTLMNGMPGSNNGGAGIDLEVDALDRPVMLFNSPYTAGKLTVLRLESGTWVQLGSATQINSTPAAYWGARLALDSADGITPYVAYRPDGAAQETIVTLRYTNPGWSQAPALARGLDADFDFAVAGGQPVLAYLDGATTDTARVYVSRGGASGWSAGVQVNADTDRPVVATRMLATGPSQDDLLVAYEEADATFGKHQVAFKKGPDWSRVPGDVPQIAGADMRGFAMAADASRIAVVWTTSETPLVAYHEFAR